MCTSIYIVRHAESEVGGGENARLTAKGIEQAQYLAKCLTSWPDDEGPNWVVTSNYLAPVQTALCIAPNHNTTIELEDRIARQRPAATLSDGSPRPAETLEDVEIRVEGFLRDLLDRHWGEAVVVVTHDLVARILERLITGRPQSSSLDGIKPLPLGVGIAYRNVRRSPDGIFNGGSYRL